jgi:glycosyltransferase involved in cell wall biosynthesis
MVLAVLIPVYNEASLAPRLLERLLRTPPPELRVPTDERRAHDGRVPMTRRVYLCDDASTDGTHDALLRAIGPAGTTSTSSANGEPAGTRDAVRLLRHERNLGKGAAVRTCLLAALSDTPAPDVVLIQDADLEYDPADHARLVEPILDGRADAVMGTRFGGEAHRALYFWHYVANRAITLLSNACTNLNLSDIECCLKAFTREVASKLALRENRFGIEPEIVAKVARARLPAPAAGPATATRRARVYEVAVSYAGRTYSEGKKIRWHDGISAVRCIIRYNLLP